MNKTYENWKEQNNEELIIILAHRAIKIPLMCPHCKKWTKPPIKSVKVDCEQCKKEFEKNPLDDEINEMEILRDAGWVIDKAFAVQKEIKVQYTDKNQAKAEYLAELYHDAYGIIIKERKLVKIKNDKTNQPMIVNQMVLSKPEYMLLYEEK